MTTKQKIEAMIEKTNSEAKDAHRRYLKNVQILAENPEAEDAEYYGMKVIESAKKYHALLDQLKMLEWLMKEGE